MVLQSEGCHFRKKKLFAACSGITRGCDSRILWHFGKRVKHIIASGPGGDLIVLPEFGHRGSAANIMTKYKLNPN